MINELFSPTVIGGALMIVAIALFLFGYWKLLTEEEEDEEL